jgi:hypothetical protein
LPWRPSSSLSSVGLPHVFSTRRHDETSAGARAAPAGVTSIIIPFESDDPPDATSTDGGAESLVELGAGKDGRTTFLLVAAPTGTDPAATGTSSPRSHRRRTR